jgi:hypothetical protein
VKEDEVRNLTVYRVAALALVAGMLGACTAANADEQGLPAEDLPAASAFKAGTCQSTAQDVLALAGLARKIIDAKSVSAADRDQLRDRQARIAQFRADADEQLAKPLQDLVTSIGWVRIRFNGQTYDPTIVRQMDQSRRAYQQLCVG